MLTIKLSNGLESYVDDQDFSYLNQFRWGPLKSGKLIYATGWVNGRTIPMHRLLMSAPKGVVVDHLNHDPLDNRRSNLRLCTQRENVSNQRKLKGKGQYKGVFRDGGRFLALITVNYKTVYLGRYASPESAARAYDQAATQHFGSFACLNFSEAA